MTIPAVANHHHRHRPRWKSRGVRGYLLKINCASPGTRLRLPRTCRYDRILVIFILRFLLSYPSSALSESSGDLASLALGVLHIIEPVFFASLSSLTFAAAVTRWSGRMYESSQLPCQSWTWLTSESGDGTRSKGPKLSRTYSTTPRKGWMSFWLRASWKSIRHDQFLSISVYDDENYVPRSCSW